MASRWIASGRGKRAFDLVVAVPACFVAAPVGLVVAVLVRCRLGTPVMFGQVRAGRFEAPVRVRKFRSMSDERDSSGALLPDDQRLGPFGTVLRGTSLDEIPQLWSVVRGEMSLVGPRPLPMTYVERYSDAQRRRLEAKPGITGWAQVNGRNSTTWPDRLAFDVWYVDHASLVVDVRILVRTVAIALKRDGVSAEGHATMPEFGGEP